MKIGIVTSTVREPRKSLNVAKWVLKNANNRTDENVSYEIIDLQEFDLPIMGLSQTKEQTESIKNWKNSFSKLDGIIFVVAEYNRAPTGAMKNALDYLMPELHNKTASYVGYGGLGGSRAIEHMRLINAEQGMASIRPTVNLLLRGDFIENKVDNKPHLQSGLNAMIDQLLLWTKALKTIR